MRSKAYRCFTKQMKAQRENKKLEWITRGNGRTCKPIVLTGVGFCAVKIHFFKIILGKITSPKGCWEVHQSEVPSAAMATKVRS